MAPIRANQHTLYFHVVEIDCQFGGKKSAIEIDSIVVQAPHIAATVAGWCRVSSHTEAHSIAAS